MMKTIYTLVAVLLLTFSSNAKVESFELSSPDDSIQIGIKLTDRTYYNLTVDSEEILWYSPLSMTTSAGDYGVNPVLTKSNRSEHRDSIDTVWGIRKTIEDHYNQLSLQFEGGYAIVFRAYNDGIAYRFQSTQPGELTVFDEEIQYRFLEDYEMINHVVDSFTTSYEKLYTHQPISDIGEQNLISLPSVIRAGNDNVLLSIVESDLFEYPGFYLSRKGTHQRFYLDGKLPRYPTKWEIGGWGNFSLIVQERADFLAKTTGNRDFPWRAMAIARTDAELADNDLVYKLARPSQIETDWIRPGKVAWDWYNALNLTGVDFETGINDKTYEYFIDFAAENNIDYVIMDEGWSDQFDVLLPTSYVDMEHLTAYAKKKGVRLILWAVWHTIDRQYKAAFELFKKWGIAGVKVDFIDRDDQIAIEFYERLVKEAAKYELLVDYHGCSKPTGLHRTYPNLVNYEAVRGNEYNKFAEDESPKHNIDIVFTRMLAGPMDYTPGSMRNSTEGNFSMNNENPMSQGTRAHQMAMFVVYYAPLQMLCDAPTYYEACPDILDFLSNVPTTWDETQVLSGNISEHVVIARQKGDDWFVGGLTNWEERPYSVDLSFLAKGSYKAKILKDSPNSNRIASDYQYEEMEVASNDTIDLIMKKGGGFAIHLVKQK